MIRRYSLRLPSQCEFHNSIIYSDLQDLNYYNSLLSAPPASSSPFSQSHFTQGCLNLLMAPSSNSTPSTASYHLNSHTYGFQNNAQTLQPPSSNLPLFSTLIFCCLLPFLDLPRRNHSSDDFPPICYCLHSALTTATILSPISYILIIHSELFKMPIFQGSVPRLPSQKESLCPLNL